ncbi:uncharacterized protein LOC135162200 [Diachasmimorpha longicaudata]|uniref:uncharacterized protein LOC135162200 n=1 Tax=Diachasmimorpha longicaudata TaxID=58733 RepID=UPI0030B8B097
MAATEEAQSIGKKILSIVNFVNHVIVLSVTGFILYLAGWELNVTSVHAGLCTVGYVLLMSEGLMVLTSESPLSRQLKSYKTRSHVHWCLQILGASFTIAGTSIIYLTKKNHFRSVHGILGITSVAIMIFLGISGASVFYAYQLRKILKPVGTKAMHNFLGIACFIIGIVCQCYGYNKKWMTKKCGQDVATFCIVLTAISALICLHRPFVSLYRHGSALVSRR